MTTHRTELTVILLLFAVTSFAQPVIVSSITIDTVTSFGEPLPGCEILIEGQDFQKGLIIKGRTTVVLPRGTYHLTSKATAYYWGSDRIVDVITPKAFVLIVLAPKEAYSVSGEGTLTPYTVSGDVRMAHPPGDKIFVRLRGLYLPDCVESDVDEKGHFELAVRRQGNYCAEVVAGKSILCTKSIRLDESTQRPLRIDLVVPGRDRIGVSP